MFNTDATIIGQPTQYTSATSHFAGNIFSLQWVESMDAEPMDLEGCLYLFCHYFLKKHPSSCANFFSFLVLHTKRSYILKAIPNSCSTQCWEWYPAGYWHGGGVGGKHSQLQDSQVGFQVIGILLGLCLHVALQGGQILRIVPRGESRWVS